MNKVKKLHLLLLLLWLSNLVGLAANTDIMTCEKVIVGNTTFESPKGIGYYSNTGKLLYVSSSPDVLHVINKLDASSQICYKSIFENKIKLQQSNKPTQKGDANEDYKSNNYTYSLIVLIYFIVLFFIFKIRRSIDFLNPLKIADYPVHVNLLILIILPVMISILLKGTIMFGFILLVLSLLMYMLVIDFFLVRSLDIDLPVGNFVGNIFKYINILFLVFVALNLTLGAQEVEGLYEGAFIYGLLLFFMLHTIRIILISQKNIKISQLIYYLCALEILPVLFLKEYYVI